MDKIDLDRVQVSSAYLVQPAAPSDSVPRHRKGELFLKGPVPMYWLEQAAMLPGKACAVAMVIWQRVGMEGSTTIKLSNKPLQRCGVDRYAKQRALEHLKQAGLIAVVQKPGCSPEVTVLEGRGLGDG